MIRERRWLNGGVKARGQVREVLAAYRGAVEGDAKARDGIEGLIRVSDVETVSPDRGLAKTGGLREKRP